VATGVGQDADRDVAGGDVVVGVAQASRGDLDRPSFWRGSSSSISMVS
jgi:hypothetical protein